MSAPGVLHRRAHEEACNPQAIDEALGPASQEPRAEHLAKTGNPAVGTWTPPWPRDKLVLVAFLGLGGRESKAAEA